MNAFFERHQGIRDILSIAGFIIAVFAGAALINLTLFRSFSVVGPSMEPTMFTGDRLIINRLPLTWSFLTGSDYVPPRGQVIVFRNPHWIPGGADEYVVKRVIAFPGERVTVVDGVMRVYNDKNPDGMLVDEVNPGPVGPTSGSVDTTVPSDSLFVSGDHRQGDYSLDSRNGLGTIPYDHLIGPVTLRIFPFTQFRLF